MNMKSIFFVVAVAALVGAAIASCPNGCNGHGSCGNHDRCKCYANYVGGDCSEKACPYGRSEHECSGRGTCDRGSGTCECADGYSGAACQRISCPNDCSGKGSCDTTTGMCNCAGGYSGNDCGTRLCPKGDDPLTHEVENSGDGTASQQSEVQTVSFNAGRGLGGTATLTYNDLYGQSWTTRPFNVGGDNIYRLEVAIAPGTTCSGNKCKLKFTYNGADSALVEVHGTGSTFLASTASITAESIRGVLLKLFGGHRGETDTVGKDRGNTILVKKHHSSTSAKIGGSIRASARLTFDIHLPIEMSGHDDNGQLSSALTVAWGDAPAANTQDVNLHSLGDRSAEIESALTSLPNQVIPSVTVSKVGVTDSGTNSDGTNGNVYAQSYAVTFNNEANSGDQNMLTCNAAPCDEDGCINRGHGVSEVRYMHHDPESHGEGINFVNQGYFIMDVGSDQVDTALSAGSIKIMWDTGAGVESAIFAIVATAAEVQTALRTITGWEAVTVELWGSKSTTSSITVNHQFKVTFAAGFDDRGKSPTFHTMLATEGAYAAPTPSSARARLYDQRFSNSIWLGKTTGYVELLTGPLVESGSLRFTDLSGLSTPIVANPENGDVWVTSDIYFGVGGGSNPGSANKEANEIIISDSSPMTGNITMYTDDNTGDLLIGASSLNFAYLKEGATSVQTSDYFAVGSTIEVLPTTWADDTPESDISSSSYKSNNLYRKFKVTGHVTNEFNREFAKLDSFPSDDGIHHATTALGDRPKYNLKITSNNGTHHSYPDLAARITLKEVQVVVINNGQAANSEVFKLYYKGEESKDMTHGSTKEQVAEEISSFSALSGPVEVTKEGINFVVTFDEKDGDVAQMTAVTTAGTVNVVTRAHGWSIEGPVALGLDSMQAGGVINVTAKETCTFTITGKGTNTAVFFCYDGTCSSEVATNPGASADWEDAVESIRDDNGDKIFATDTVSAVNDATGTITLPLGYSCDGLEMRLDTHDTTATTKIKKTVDKHNNGKQFKITRSFMTSAIISGSVSGAQAFTCGATGDEGGCHQADSNVDSLVISDGTSNDCGVHIADGAAPTTNFLIDNGQYPISRTISTAGRSGSSAAAAMTLSSALNNNGAKDHTSNCKYTIARHVITLDAAPTSSATTTTKTLLYNSPVGGCSVAETTKGTYESYECSNRGQCDGKSGLCSCYEGYSGQSCQTQTVLV